ncbi:MAG: hypothetical protein EA378_09585 [Phycisphaerales bacterium]|nr:MAG: hypothetical protein EA378_09585 [Phycisphaerales bacterium]
MGTEAALAWLWISAAVLGAVAFAGLVFGLVGRTVRVGPHCRNCRFDLAGTKLDADDARCPECGRELDRPRAVLARLRRRRLGVVAGSIALLLIAGALGTAYGVQRFAGYNWRQHFPTAWLVHEATRSQDQQGADAALAELIVRLEADELGERHMRTLADEAVVRYEDEYSYWSPGWGTIAGEAWTLGLLTDEQRFALLRGVIDPEIVHRPVIRHGDTMPIRFSGVTRPIDGINVRISVRPLAIGPDERHVEGFIHGMSTSVQKQPWQRSLGFRGYAPMGWSGAPLFRAVEHGASRDETFPYLAVAADSGEQTLMVPLLFEARLVSMSEMGTSVRQAHDLSGRTREEIAQSSDDVSRWVVDWEVPVRVFPRDAREDIEYASNTESDRSMTDAVWLGPIAKNPWGASTNLEVWTQFNAGPNEPGGRLASIAGRFVAEAEDGRRWYLGVGSIPAGGGWSGTGLSTSESPVHEGSPRQHGMDHEEIAHLAPFEPLEDLFEFEHIDVRMIPSPANARGSVEVAPIWHREVIFRRVPINAEEGSGGGGVPMTQERMQSLGQVTVILDADTGEVVWERPPEPEAETEASAPNGG